MLLAKHAQGKPLSLAELRQRKNAARARWAGVAGASAAGAAAGGLIARSRVDTAIGATRNQIRDAVRSNLTPAIETGLAQDQRVISRAERVRRRIAGKQLVPRALRTLVSEFRAESVANRRQVTEIGEARRFDPHSGMFESADAAAAQLAEDIAPLGERIQDLRTNHRPPRTTVVTATTTTPRQESYVRRGAMRTIEVSPEDPRYPTSRSSHIILGLEERRELLRETRARIDELARDPTVASYPHERVDLDDIIERYGRPRRIRIRGASARVTNVPRERPAHSRRVEGYPDTAGRTALRDHVLGLLRDKEAKIRERTAMRRISRIDAAKTTTREQLGDALSRLKVLRHGRLGLLGAGIGLGAGAAGLIAHHITRVAAEKSGSVRKMENAEITAFFAVEFEELLAKARRDRPEDTIGLGLGVAFREWIDKLLGKTEGPIAMADDVAKAMAPGITDAFAAGARDVPIDKERSDPSSWIDVDFDVLNPSVRRYMADYALDRIAEITTAQRAAIRDAIMTQAVLQGIGPIEVARTIRESIGLTAYQQNVVNSFRQGLEDLDPRVLERKLRDRRYDSTIRKAIEAGEALTPDQINAMVDAYHRRALALRARTIARTEALRATTHGGIARAQEVLDEHPELEVTKRWLSTDDEKTRDTHRDLMGREVEGMTTQFITSKGNPIRWPLDEAAAAEEVVNCRCTLEFIFHPKRSALQAVAA